MRECELVFNGDEPRERSAEARELWPFVDRRTQHRVCGEQRTRKLLGGRSRNRPCFKGHHRARDAVVVIDSALGAFSCRARFIRLWLSV